MSLRDEIINLVIAYPGKTSKEITDIYDELPLPRIQETLSRLCTTGRLEKKGKIPYTYYAVSSTQKIEETSSKKTFPGNKLATSTNDLIESFIKDNNKGTYTEFYEKYGKLCSDAHFYMKRRAITGIVHKRGTNHKTPKKTKNSSLYMVIWSYPVEGTTPKSMEMLNSFIESLNAARRAQWEVVELKNPAVYEVRERTA